MNKFITIDGRKIGPEYLPYVIAEMSANHNGDIDNAYKVIDMAKSAGAHALKLQTYTADTMTIDSDLPDFQLTKGLWAGRTLYDLYEEAHTPWNWHKPLFDYARRIGITMFSSPFDITAVDLLESLNAPAYKIASFEAIDLPLIKYVAGTGKPLIISTGMADADEIKEAIDTATEGGCKELAILHCVSGYPAPSHEYNLTTLKDMQKRYGLVTGLSDHTLDNTTAVTSVAFNASIIEKHVTLSRSGGGPDDSFSLEFKELEALCSSTSVAWNAIGCVDYEKKLSEKENAKLRRSLYFVKNIKSGEVITPDHLRSIRPGYGLLPKHYDLLIGKKVNQDISRGTAASWKLIII